MAHVGQQIGQRLGVVRALLTGPVVSQDDSFGLVLVDIDPVDQDRVPAGILGFIASELAECLERVVTGQHLVWPACVGADVGGDRAVLSMGLEACDHRIHVALARVAVVVAQR
ncbi:Uncharacterised protein [Mycobacteroides abscessus]|nr:Uncharacterised protein [Mycobacteroides abscessus]